MSTAAGDATRSGRERSFWLALRVLALQRFSISMLVLLYLLLLQVAQFREFLLLYPLRSIQGLMELAGVGLSALAVWYSGRIVYRVRFPGFPGGDPDQVQRYPLIRKWLPRALATAVPLAACMACVQLGLLDKAIAYAALALLVLSWVTVRRHALRMGKRALGQRADGSPVSAADETMVADLQSLPHSYRRVALAAKLGAASLFLCSLFAPAWLPQMIGTSAFLFLSGSIVTLLGTAGVYHCARLRIPMTAAVLLWIGLVMMIPYGKLHMILDADPGTGPPTSTGAPASLHAHLMSSGPAPVLLAAEGGGIRAAYWTALVLHSLDVLSAGEFRNRLSLASGVSGGSLGLATYALSERISKPHPDCPGSAAQAAGLEAIQLMRLELAACMLSQDFLAPAAARLLWVDSIRLFLPIPLWTDRGRALEQAWAVSWNEIGGGDAFDAPLSALAGADDPASGPRTVWVFNATNVESGRRVIQSAPALTDLGKIAPSAIDGQRMLGERLTIAQAVHNSARFTYVSPAGTVEVPQREGQAHGYAQLVDGGYFENSGLTLINDWLMHRIREMARRMPGPDDAAHSAKLAAAMGEVDRSGAAKPWVILLSNDPVKVENRCSRPAGRDAMPSLLCRGDDRFASPDDFRNEITAPPKTLISVRSARGEYARCQARGLAGHENFFHLSTFRNSEVAIPLGWTLSPDSMHEMKLQLWCDHGCVADDMNRKALLAIAERIGISSADARNRLQALCDHATRERPDLAGAKACACETAG